MGRNDLLFELSGEHGVWCAFHKPDEAEEYLGLDTGQVGLALKEVIEEQARLFHSVSLAGFDIRGDLEISGRNILGEPVSPDWSSGLTRLDLRGCKVDGDLVISDLVANDIDIEANDLEVVGSCSISLHPDHRVNAINLAKSRVADDLSITCQTHAHLRKIDLSNLVCRKRINISGLCVESSININRAKIAYALQIRNCAIGPHQSPDERSSLDERIYACLVNVMELGDPRDGGDVTKFGPLLIDKCDVHGSILLVPTTAMHMQISRTKIDGLIETSGLAIPDNTMVFELSLGEAVSDPSALPAEAYRAGSEYDPYYLARFKRSFRAIRAVVRDSDQQAALLRQERAVTRTISKVDDVTRAIWWAHELFTESGANWRYPIAVLACNAILFVSLLLYFEPDITPAQAIAISATNSIAPFLSLQSVVDRTSLLAVLLSVAQSAMTAVLLSSIYFSLKAKILD